MNQNDAPLLEAMYRAKERGIIPFDVPGHKKSNNIKELVDFLGERALGFDFNSFKDIDSLNHPEGVIRESQELMADAFGSDHAFFIVNGTSQAIQVMILSVCKPKDKIILPRNIHKSVINSLILCNAIPVYIQPEIDDVYNFATGIGIEKTKKAIKDNPDAKAIFLINPTYYGMCSELEEISEFAHQYGLAVLVDEAHGAHFKFHPDMPNSAMECGADMSAISLHKTGGSLTQASALLLNTRTISKDMVEKTLNLFTTTSASYLLMTSLDIARRHLAVSGEEQLGKVLEMVRNAKIEINKIGGYSAYGRELIGKPGIYDIDEFKLGIKVSDLGITGFEVYDKLYNEYNIQVELADTHNILAITGIGDTQENIDKLISALKDIKEKLPKKAELDIEAVPFKNPKVVITPREAFYSNKKFVPIEDAVGKIIAESVMIYPPGIPILVPGEEITQDIVKYVQFLKNKHAKLSDMSDTTHEKFLVVIRRKK